MENTTNVDKVKSGEMSHLDFLINSNEFDDYKDWCNSHGVEINNKSAEFYFDQTFIYDYNESEVLMEIFP